MGLDTELDPLSRKVLDAIDVGEQRDDINDLRSSAAVVGVVVLFIVESFAHGEHLVHAIKLLVERLT